MTHKNPLWVVLVLSAAFSKLMQQEKTHHLYNQACETTNNKQAKLNKQTN